MGPEAERREQRQRWLFAGLALLALLLLIDYVSLQWRTAVPEFTFIWHDEGQEPSIVHQVIPGGGAEAAGAPHRRHLNRRQARASRPEP
jgi:hypothetical protein